MLRVWLAKEVRAFDQLSFHLVGDGIAGRVEHSQIRPQRDGLLRKGASALDQSFQIDIGKHRIDGLRRTQDRKRFVDVAGGEYLMAQVLNYHLRYYADKHIVFAIRITAITNPSAVTTFLRLQGSYPPLLWHSEPVRTPSR